MTKEEIEKLAGYDTNPVEFAIEISNAQIDEAIKIMNARIEMCDPVFQLCYRIAIRELEDLKL